MTHIIWLMNENLSDTVQITLRQLSAKSNVDVRTLKAKLPQLCSKNYLEYAKIEGEVCSLAYKNATFVQANSTPRLDSRPPNIINIINKNNGKFDNLTKQKEGGNSNVGKSEPQFDVGGIEKRLSLADL